MIITCLHTADSNIAVFEAAARGLELPQGVLRHAVRADLLQAAEREGGLTEALACETAAVVSALSGEADAVLLTCSTLGPSVAKVTSGAGAPVLRVDAALAQEAARIAGQGKLMALCAVETTVGPTTQLFAEATRHTGAELEVRLVKGAWSRFKGGDHDGYLSAIAAAVEAVYREGAAIVALAQASMAGAADRVCSGPKPLTSPRAGLGAAVRAMAAARP